MTAKDAVKLITALRDLTTETGTVTTRTQNKILQSLTDADLLRVAVELKQRAEMTAGLYGKVSEAINVDAR